MHTYNDLPFFSIGGNDDIETVLTIPSKCSPFITQHFVMLPFHRHLLLLCHMCILCMSWNKKKPINLDLLKKFNPDLFGASFNEPGSTCSLNDECSQLNRAVNGATNQWVLSIKFQCKFCRQKWEKQAFIFLLAGLKFNNIFIFTRQWSNN